MSALGKQQILNPRSVLRSELGEGVRIVMGEVYDISGARAQGLPTAVEAP
ncbi:hypothetical protein ABZ636_40405 [Streptomyces sp. NPDC007251]